MIKFRKRKQTNYYFFKINLSKVLIPQPSKDYSLTLSYCGQVFLMDYDTLINKKLALGRIVKLCKLCCLLASYTFPATKAGRRSRTVVHFIHYQS